jgi:hypothetical protein
MTRDHPRSLDNRPHRKESLVFGQPQYSQINSTLLRMFERRGTLIAVHRGTGLGAIVENTTPAVIAASRSGADLVEVDVVESSDGDYFVFHDGMEPHHFGFDRNLQSLRSAEIEALRYRQRTAEPFARVERLENMLQAVPPEVVLNIDRSWRYWPRLFSTIQTWGAADRVLMKVNGGDDAALSAARAHPVKFPLLPIVASAEEAERVLDDTELNVVGLELVASEPTHPFCDPGWLADLRARGIFAYVNALDLGNSEPLFAGWDDTVSVLDGPDRGWKHLVDRGADVIQTDWPSLLSQYLEHRGARDTAAEPAAVT